MRRIYVASSWRNTEQPGVVRTLRAAGYEVYDFRHPKPDDDGFHWSEIDPDWQGWSASEYRASLSHPIAERGFANDFEAMQWADTCVLLLPSGRSAHLEAGWFAGQGKTLAILLGGDVEPELMYRMATIICVSLDELMRGLSGLDRHFGPIVQEPA